MLMIFSNSTKNTMGGVEIFNEELELLLKKKNIKFNKQESNLKNKHLNYIHRVIKSLFYIYTSRNKIDFILVQYGNFLDILIIPLLFISLKKIKVICHIGDTWKHINNLYLRKLTNIILQFFVYELFIITDEQKQFLKHKRTKKIHTIISENFLQPNINKKENFILFLGRICKEKGIEDLIKAYSNLIKRIKLPNLVLIGPCKDDYMKKVFNLIEENHLTENIFIKEAIYELDKKIALIDSSEFLIYPSYADAFPLTVIESFSRKIPCLATKISETKNFIEFDEFLFEPGNINELELKLCFLITNKNNINRHLELMHKKAIEYATGQIINEIL